MKLPIRITVRYAFVAPARLWFVAGVCLKQTAMTTGDRWSPLTT